jgi:hypothetical protein
MFGSLGASGTGWFDTSTGQQNNGQKGPNKGPNNEKKETNNGKKKGPNNGQNKNGQNKQEEQSNFNSNDGVFSIPIIKEFSNLNTKNIEIAEQEGMIGCNVC